jgi:group I intron endonuclease
MEILILHPIMGYIYKVVNTVNQKVYIGLTMSSLKLRKQRHFSHARAKITNSIFHKALIKYGEYSFEWKIIWKGKDSELEEKERYYIKEYDSFFKTGHGYNMTFGGSIQSGLNHPSADHTLYTFYHKSGKIEKNVTRHHMMNKHDLKSNNLTSVITGKAKTVYGWTLNKDNFIWKKRERSMKNYSHDSTFYSFKHKNGRTELAITRMDMIIKYPILTQTGMCELINNKYKSHKGWVLI